MKDGMVQDEAVYRCIGAQCGRLMPRRVNYCPWCGTAQQAGQPAGVPPPMLAKPPVAPPHVGPAAPEPAQAAPQAQLTPQAQAPAPGPGSISTGASTAAASATAAAPGTASPSAAAPRSSAPVPPPPPPSPASPAPPPAGASRAGPGRGIPPPPGVGPGRGPATPARPPQRAPIRLRWWILALGALWIIWMTVRPSGSRIERRMDRAVALAVECKAREAQDELIALRGTRATPEQLRQVQTSLNKAAADCTRAEQRARAWEDTAADVRKLRRARSYDKALARLATFTKRWGEDDATRKLRQDINDERHHPLADPTRNE
ncbi:hypothetical protein [Massilia consociata]|uniref:Uncharacterized protein n=1 Tax=Massilia consociata TaxID=760117 RepID=A0ABV6FII7_9BURK